MIKCKSIRGIGSPVLLPCDVDQYCNEKNSINDWQHWWLKSVTCPIDISLNNFISCSLTKGVHAVELPYKQKEFNVIFKNLCNKLCTTSSRLVAMFQPENRSFSKALQGLVKALFSSYEIMQMYFKKGLTLWKYH